MDLYFQKPPSAGCLHGAPDGARVGIFVRPSLAEDNGTLNGNQGCIEGYIGTSTIAENHIEMTWELL